MASGPGFACVIRGFVTAARQDQDSVTQNFYRSPLDGVALQYARVDFERLSGMGYLLSVGRSSKFIRSVT
jgi:hypothetical protein